MVEPRTAAASRSGQRSSDSGATRWLTWAKRCLPPWWYRWLRKEVKSPATAPKVASPKALSRPRSRNVACAALLLLLCFLVRPNLHSQPAGDALLETCVDHVVTHTGSIDGAPVSRRNCDTEVRRGRAGYCVCSGRMAVPAKPQIWGHVNCDHLCAATPESTARKIPELSSCPKGHNPFFPANPAPVPATTWRVHLIVAWWKKVSHAMRPTDRAILPPGKRTQTEDFVALGHHLRPEHRAMARQDWKAFVELAGPYPASSFSGQGIAILSGSMNYLVPSLIAVKALRRAGCQLPVELWFPTNESPPPALTFKFKRLGATARTFPVPSVLGKGGFYMKSIVLMLSSFKEVLLLDADQVPVADPTVLFDDPGYKETGALLWPDLWFASWAPDLPKILDVPAEDLPTRSFESGQMMFDKSKTWPALALALHFNIHHQLYAPLFTNYMGMGDKDSYVMAILAMHLPYSMVQHSASALGFATRKCSWISCSDTMSTNSIMQHAPDGTMMFLHANMPPKWYLAVAADWEAQQRRWTVISPGPDTLLQSFKEAIDHHLGFDPELWVHEQLVALQCDDDMRAAAHAHDRTLSPSERYPPSLFNARLPFLPGGVDLMRVYEQDGMAGEFVEFNNPSWWQRLSHWLSTQRFGRRKWWKAIFKHPRSRASTLGSVALTRS